jgi:regulator of replication initiation timing
MAINQNDIDLAMYLLDNAIYAGRSMGPHDCALIKKFIEALLEQQQKPSENTKSREWRAAVYRKLLDDPQALEQFTRQALEKFGPENLARMVAPELQTLIVDQNISDMSIPALVELLKAHGKLTETLEYVMENEEEWVIEHFNLQERIDHAYDTGLAEGREIAKEDPNEEEYDRGYNEGYDAGFDAADGRRRPPGPSQRY